MCGEIGRHATDSTAQTVRGRALELGGDVELVAGRGGVPGDVGFADVLGSVDAPAAHYALEDLHDPRVEVAAGAGPDVGKRVGRRPTLAVRAVGGERVPHVGHGDDPGLERDGAAREATGIPATVDALMVMEDHRERLVQRG